MISNIGVQLEQYLNNKIEQINSDPNIKARAHQALYDISFPYVPYDTGRLSTDVTISAESITYNAPYATRQYTDGSINHKTEHHPLATSDWVNVSLQSGGEEFRETVKRIIIEEIGND